MTTLSDPAITVRPSPIEGLGVFATRPLAAGGPVLAVDDTHPAFTVPSPQEARFHDFLENGRVVVMQSPERHINHSCQPNAAILTRGGTRIIQALRSLAPGDELTIDYSINGSGDTVWSCHCGAPRCRRSVHSDFFHLPLALQQEYLPLLDLWFRRQHAAEIDRLQASLEPTSNAPQGHAHAPRP